MEAFLNRILELMGNIYQSLRNFPLETEFPRHLYIPREAESVDIRRLCEIEANSTTPVRLITVKAETSEEFIFTHYALFTDALLASDVEWFFKLNGKKILRYHGHPDSATEPRKYSLNIGVAPDISASSLIPGYIRVKPGDELTIDVVNRNTEVNYPIGVRLAGYLNVVQSRKERIIR